MTEAPITLSPAPPDASTYRATRGKKRPRGLAWFGFRSFWGPLYHLVASIVATEDIDSRDWMQADKPSKLARRVAKILNAATPTPGLQVLPQGATPTTGVAPPIQAATITLGGDVKAPTIEPTSLAELLDRDVWVDFIADTGDDVSVSEAVGRAFVAIYALPDPDPRDGPDVVVSSRGDILLHGGDLAYPVATDLEIHNRFVAPFNSAFPDADDGRRRALMGVPGNHDWYSGLDGFGRLMRRRVGPPSHDPHGGSTSPRTHLHRTLHWAGQFLRVDQLQKRRTLVLHGYVPVQDATYFVLPLAPRLDLWGVDRQLRSIDYRQRRYFDEWRMAHPDRRRIVLFPDPVYAHLEPSKTGVAMARALKLDIESTPHLCIAGDLHHYERLRMGASLHVTAGGGGAFLHGARLNRRARPAPECEWPGPWATAAMLLRVPFQIVLGRAGFIPHVLLLALFAPLLVVSAWAFSPPVGARVATAMAGIFLALGAAFTSGHQVNLKRYTIPLAAVLGLWIASAPIAAAWLIESLAGLTHVARPSWAHPAVVLLVAIPIGTFALGVLVAALTALGLENTLAITALGHPGYKHFVRMRVRRDGSRVDAWVIGLMDPLAPDAKPVLVDRWSWQPWT
ncbi:MAG: hypothetical protein ABSC94_20140 [Polyangiaceae bacterium]